MIVFIKNIVVLLLICIKINNIIINLFKKSLVLIKVNTTTDTIILAIKISKKIYKLIRYNKTIAKLIYNC